MSAIVEWPSNTPGAREDYIEYTMGPFPGRKFDGEPDLTKRCIRINVSFMLSRWSCFYGSCPGVLINGADLDTACCQIGVHINSDEWSRVTKYVGMLTEADCDNMKEVKDGSWKYKEKDLDERKDGWKYHTTVKDGRCVFANREKGPAGKQGCALHHLANRIGVHHSETKPDICWQVPVAVQESYDEDRGVYVIDVGATYGRTWGSSTVDSVDVPGWFCTETPEGYAGNDLVYRTNEVELRKQMGDDAYEKMVELLDDWISTGLPVTPMPGAVANNGRPLLPLMVQQRVEMWEKDAGDKNSTTRTNSIQALKRSAAYLTPREADSDDAAGDAGDR